MVSSAVQISSRSGKTKIGDKQVLGKFLNYCPVISISGSEMQEYSAAKLLQQLKRAYADRVVRNGFDDTNLYNDELFKLDAVDIKRFDDLKGIIVTSNTVYYNILILTNDQIEAIMKFVPKEFHSLFNNMMKRDYVERVRSRDQEFMYAGHADEDVYLFYMGRDCFGRFDINLSENHTYKVDVIDTWNMTRETVMTGVKGTVEVKLPGREYMAVLATAED